ncbi:hypothetical protein D5086_024464 [Populus alba]|uniref:Uncharacterized protein n=1 Tax=Populus alba TaxID=43335 RepID=A0ACC4B679_POPAL
MLSSASMVDIKWVFDHLAGVQGPGMTFHAYGYLSALAGVMLLLLAIADWMELVYLWLLVVAALGSFI